VDAALGREGQIIARYLAGGPVPDELVNRWMEACRRCFPTPLPPPDRALVDFVVRHPWSVSYLDAACGLVRRDGALRSRVLIMAAILEASAPFADEWLPRSVSRAAFVTRLAALGMVAVARTAIGLALLPLAGRTTG